jgi:hypothetical protein
LISEKELEKLWEAAVEDHHRTVEECAVKFEQRYGFTLRGTIMEFAGKLLEAGDAATLIGLTFLLDGMSREVEEMCK